jgi:hypothetical protein
VRVEIWRVLIETANGSALLYAEAV